MNWFKHNVFEILDILKFVGILLLVLMFIHFNTAVARQSQETQKIAANTNRVVKSQDDILQAIKRATEDNQLTSEQKLNITICMLKVPVSQRTTDVEHNCRSLATTPSLNSGTPAALPQTTPKSSQPKDGSQATQNSSNNPKTSPSQPQPNVIQQIVNKVKGIL